MYIDEPLCWKGLQVIKFKVITPAYLTAYSVEKEITYFSMIRNAALFSSQNQISLFNFIFMQCISDLFLY